MNQASKYCISAFLLALVFSSCTIRPSMVSNSGTADSNARNDISIEQYNLGITIRNKIDVMKMENGQGTNLGHLKYDYDANMHNNVRYIRFNAMDYYIISAYGGSGENHLVIAKNKDKLIGCGNIDGIFDFYDGHFLGQSIVSGPIVTFDNYKYDCHIVENNSLHKVIMSDDFVTKFSMYKKFDFYSRFGLLFENRKDLINKNWVDKNMPKEYIKDMSYQVYHQRYDEYLRNHQSLSFRSEEARNLIYNKWYFYKIMNWQTK